MTDAREALIYLCSSMRNAAREEILPRFASRAFTPRSKQSPDDLVTEADIEAERYITADLRRPWPDALIVGEEAAYLNPSIVGRLAAAELAFVLDPVDGTRNFVSGSSVFAVIGAVVRDGRVVAGAILDPVQDDLLFAVEGYGSWRGTIEGHRSRLAIRTDKQISDMEGVGHWRGDRTKLRVTESAVRSFKSLACSGQEFRRVLNGDCDFVLADGQPLKPWDYAAGVLLVREAGGCAATLDRSCWSGLSPATSLLCANSHVWADLHAVLLAGAGKNDSDRLEN